MAPPSRQPSFTAASQPPATPWVVSWNERLEASGDSDSQRSSGLAQMQPCSGKLTTAEVVGQLIIESANCWLAKFSTAACTA